MRTPVKIAPAIALVIALVVALTTGLFATGSALAQQQRSRFADPPNHCLSATETRAAISEKRAVTPAVALQLAVARGSEPLRARLCLHNDQLTYFVTALAKDGKVLMVVVDAATGSVIERR